MALLKAKWFYQEEEVRELKKVAIPAIANNISNVSIEVRQTAARVNEFNSRFDRIDDFVMKLMNAGSSVHHAPQVIVQPTSGLNLAQPQAIVNPLRH